MAHQAMESPGAGALDRRRVSRVCSLEQRLQPGNAVPGRFRAITSMPPPGSVQGSRASDSRQRSSMSIGARWAALSA